MSSSSQQIIEQIEQRARQLLQLAAPLCAARRTRLPDPIIAYDLRGLAAGQAVWRRARRPVLRFNLDIARHHRKDFVERTVAHEVAHVIAAACYGRVRPHGAEWRSVMAQLGIANPSRCHDYALDEIKVRRQRRWSYACECSSHELSTTRHNRILMAGTQYHCRRCGVALRPVESRVDASEQ